MKAASNNIQAIRRRSQQVLRWPTIALIIVFLTASASRPGTSQANPNRLRDFLEQNIGFSPDQIAAIEHGQPIAKAMPSRTPDEVFLFGAVRIDASPESYVRFAHDFDRLRKLPSYQALGVFSNPPQLSDLQNFAFDDDDVKALRGCRPADCLIQMPENSIEELQKTIDWSATDAKEQINQLLQKTALDKLIAYQQEGNAALGVYNDKSKPTDVQQQFVYMLSYSKVLPQRFPDFYRYLLEYPSGRTADVQDTFYWARVKFGLKPTLRVVQMVTMRGDPSDDVAYAIAEKQLYSSHYFETALDLSFCMRATGALAPGFYLLMAMGSEQAGLSGPKGAIIRKVAVGRSASNLQSALASIKSTLEVK